MEQPIPKQERKREALEDKGQEKFNNLENNPNAGSRNYTDYIEKTKEFGRNQQLPPEKLLYERDSYVAQGTFGEGDQALARAQASLSIAGYDLGNTGYKGVDGKMGPKTEAALRQVQSAAGLEPTGKLDRQTAEVLEKMTASGMKKADVETIGRKLGNGSDSSLGHEQGVAKRDELVRQAQDKYPGRDTCVMNAQASLRLAGYDLGKSGVDGFVGEKTKTAIEDYQKARGLKVTGELNAETTKALEETTKSGWTKGREQVTLRNELFKGGQGKGQDLVAYAQASLVAAGYDLGNSGYKGVDGKPGPLTTKATKEFQKAHGLEPTGRLDQKTLWTMEKATHEGWVREKENIKIDAKNGFNHDIKVEQFISVAEKELQKGFKEKNGNNITPYGKWYGLDGQPWCAMFVSWCADRAGIIDTKVPRFASVQSGKKWYIENKSYQSRESGYVPKAGDVIFFKNKKGQNHVGIVVAYDKEKNMVYTIEGNSSNAIAARNYKLDDNYINGYGVNGGTGDGQIPTKSTKGTGVNTR